jgi:Gas vesicle protein K/Gas vesicle protein
MRDLGPQYQQSVSLCDALDRVLHTGVVALGEMTLSVADVDLLYLGLQLVITSIETGPDSSSSGGRGSSPNKVVRGGLQAEAPLERSRLAPSLPPVSPRLAPACKGQASPAPPVAEPELPPSRTPNKNGLGHLVLTLIRVLHELLKRQALRRMEAGSLSVAEMERLGVSLMRQAQEIERIARDLGLKVEDLNLDLGPLGKLL